MQVFQKYPGYEVHQLGDKMVGVFEFAKKMIVSVKKLSNVQCPCPSSETYNEAFLVLLLALVSFGFCSALSKVLLKVMSCYVHTSMTGAGKEAAALTCKRGPEAL